MRASWIVQATMNEPLDLLVAFVAHYLEMGADMIHLSLDKPHPEAEAAFGQHPKIRLTRCDPAYWARVSPKGRPMGLPARQMVNSREVYATLQHDWMLMCDADEYVQMTQDMGSFLATVPEPVDFVRIRVAEKVLPPHLVPQTIFEGSFRLPRLKGVEYAAEIYGPIVAPMLERVVAGHGVGKSLVRRGRAFPLNVHGPMTPPARPGDLAPPPEPVGTSLPDAYLAHYDALTPLHYLLKLLGKFVQRRAMEDIGLKAGRRHPSRELQIALAAAACKDPDPVARTEILHRLTPDSLAALQKHGLLVDLDLAPDQIARKHFPDLTLDFTPEAFDRALRIKHAATLAEMDID